MSTFATPDPAVLVVDDDPDLADLHASFLQEEYDVRTAYGGDAGIAALDAEVDVVLLDREMPNTAGLDVVEAVEGRDLTPRIALVTGVEPDFDVLDMAIDAYLCKPVGPAALHEAVERLLAVADGPGRKLASLRAKRNLLQAAKRDVELQRSEAYRGLLAEIERLERTAEASPKATGRRVSNQFG